ncbi:ureidoglycolate hydrolase-like protein [Mollisia scopiformis]|uniref:Ureidoglycolate hydrolase-like protein n=1 Tax=Mollisia scopiformis TaxID=149040 RepID=A0A194XM75_MOLSC|nr:ureidoglycolate hydrolase-like protein [Mollisia scopiformis]KUJ20867.1 ureidoglycolate hydrolase-like protein [Mollisia scopiformis]
MAGFEQRVTLEPQVLCEAAFHDFGTVIENPAPSLVPSSKITKLPPNSVQANQGSALKYLNVTYMRDCYESAPSKVLGKAVMNMFVCAPRSLLQSSSSTVEGLFPIEILERHPYTTQTFIPLGLSSLEAQRARYLVIVAPSLPPSPADAGLPVPPLTKDGQSLPGRGLPDVGKVKAFIANGSQGVTYGAGTWHAPIVVIGEKPIDFVVVQFANGVGVEDCQETLVSEGGRAQLLVAVPKVELRSRGAKL